MTTKTLESRIQRLAVKQLIDKKELKEQTFIESANKAYSEHKAELEELSSAKACATYSQQHRLEKINQSTERWRSRLSSLKSALKADEKEFNESFKSELQEIFAMPPSNETLRYLESLNMRTGKMSQSVFKSAVDACKGNACALQTLFSFEREPLGEGFPGFPRLEDMLANADKQLASDMRWIERVMEEQLYPGIVMPAVKEPISNVALVGQLDALEHYGVI